MGRGVPDTFIVEHAGALGDFVMIWPLLRTLVRSGRPGLRSPRVWLSCARSKLRLAREWLVTDGPAPRLGWLDPDGRVMQGLWHGTVLGVPSFGYLEVYAMGMHAGRDKQHSRWSAVLSATEHHFAYVESVGPPGSRSRWELEWQWRVAEEGRVEPRLCPGGPVVLHVGAGGRAKRWGLDRFARLHAMLASAGHEVVALAGEVERERFTPEEARDFAALGGRFLNDYRELAHALASARLVVAADTGPGHLAAQIGVRVLSLFGPTPPSIWKPIGPSVHVLAPPAPTPDMSWLSVDDVAGRALELLAEEAS